MASRIDLLLNKIQLVGIHIKLPTKVSSLDFYRLRLPKLPLKIRQNYLVRACLVTVNSWTQPHGVLRSPQWGNIDQVSELTWSSRLKNAKTLKVLSHWELREVPKRENFAFDFHVFPFFNFKTRKWLLGFEFRVQNFTTRKFKFLSFFSRFRVFGAWTKTLVVSDGYF